MPRIQIYLPDDLYAAVKARKLRASELSQQALRAEIHRQERIEAANEWLAEQIAESGEPSPEDLAWAEDMAARIKAHLRPSAEEETVDLGTSAHSTRKAG
jgi:post-segregation antitoxin (ccd killing protein)